MQDKRKTKFEVPDRLYARQLPAGYFASRDLWLLWPTAQRFRLLVDAPLPAAETLVERFDTESFSDFSAK